jgi:hypothetical protein
MFDATSRYYSIELEKFVAPDGRVSSFKRRRFLPRGEDMPLLTEVTVIQGDRMDLIATRTIGDPEQFWRICDANNAMNPADLMEIGRLLKVPLPQF